MNVGFVVTDKISDHKRHNTTGFSESLYGKLHRIDFYQIYCLFKLESAILFL